ncbi:MAG: CoA ester lyase [Rhodospirillales bacterium]|nr:CoA ester lyase [Rhodospirillales bacterium]
MAEFRTVARRSALYIPGSNARALEKARTLDADVLIFDLEDAVHPERKDLARDQTMAALRQGGYRAETVVRVNPLSDKLGAADIKAAARSGCQAVLLPKVESAKEVRDAALRLAAAGAPENVVLWAMIETPLGVLRAQEIALSSPHLGCLVMGTSDLVKDLRARHSESRLAIMPSLGLCLLAARAAGLPILDGVHLDLNDESGFLAACKQGADMGFDGKTLIHPKTIEACNAAFGPSPADVEWSRKVIAAFEAASAKKEGVIVVDGKLVEQLHVDSAKRTVAMADAIARKGAPKGA